MGDTTLSLDGTPRPGGRSRMDMNVRLARWVWAMTLTSLSLLVVIVVMAVTSPTKGCVRLWNAPDNAAVRAAITAKAYRRAALTAYSVEGPGRVCYVTMLDGSGTPRGSFVIWPDNLFDNGALHDYAGPFSLEQGYLGHPLSRSPALTVTDDGRVQGL